MCLVVIILKQSQNQNSGQNGRTGHLAHLIVLIQHQDETEDDSVLLLIKLYAIKVIKLKSKNVNAMRMKLFKW